MKDFERKLIIFVNERTEAAMRDLVGYAVQHEISNEEIAQLASGLARSGQVLQFPSDARTADIASTGGPSSLSTLLGPLYLVALGLRVPKVGVPGRPAGGIDVMVQVPGYKVRLAEADVYRCIEACGFAHFLADDNNAPLDTRLFAYRRSNSIPDLPSLVIASLLAKKVAAGVRRVGLDIRVAGHGNFGRTWVEARANAKRTVAVAKALNLSATCFLTNGAAPYQPYIGRGESLLAVARVLEGVADGSLKSHDDQCFAMAVATSGVERSERPKAEVIQRCFGENLTAQGSSWGAFMTKVESLANAPRTPLSAPRCGFLHVDLRVIREVLVRLQKSTASASEPFTDPCGVVLTRREGEYVEKGDVIATVRVEGETSAQVLDCISGALEVAHTCRVAYGFEEVSNA